ncbi:MAG: DEAD/DEAH box helicase, partial [Spirochaetales bacterium]
SSRNKIDFLRRFESAVHPERCLLFASSNAAIFTIVKKLEHLGFPMAVLKSDREGAERRSALEAFGSGEARWLVTTDLGARGLDLQDVSHVISFDLPEETSIYVHRAGRTGRAGKRGVSVALADLVELRRASKIAVRYGFPFVCKILDSGIVHDIEPENFFAIAEEDEAARKNVKLEAAKRPEGRRNSPIGSSRQRSPRPSSSPAASHDDSRWPARPGNAARGARPGEDAQRRSNAAPYMRNTPESRQSSGTGGYRRGGPRTQSQPQPAPGSGSPQSPSQSPSQGTQSSPQAPGQGQQGPARQRTPSGRRRKRRGDKPGAGDKA